MSNANASRTAESWTFEREAGLILQVFAAQIRASAADGEAEGEALNAAITGFERPSSLDAAAAVAGGEAALQMVERLSQRLNHVATGLDLLAELLQDPHRAADPAAWTQLKHAIRDGYTLVAECEVFDAVAGVGR